MGGFFGAVSRRDVALDIFFGVDYHSHLGTRRAGMLIFDKQDGFQKEIHSIENTPFRTKFEQYLHKFHGSCGIGCISDFEPQPLMVRSHLGIFAISMIGVINNAESIIEKYFSSAGNQFMVMSSGAVNPVELVAAIINQNNSFVDGLRNVQELIEGSATILILTQKGHIIAARDKLGRLPMLIGKNDSGYCVAFESFAYQKLGYVDEYELCSGEIVEITPEGWSTIGEKQSKMRICSFLWSYYGYPNSSYEGKNVELVRYKNGETMACNEILNGTLPTVDHVAGVPDSGIPHAIGYSNHSHIPYARPFIKYTPTWPRSFTPTEQAVRNQVAKMKQIPIPELIEGKKLLFIDDSIVRGTQLQETVEFLYSAGAKEVHMRSACPPVMYGCKYLNFSRSNSDMELLCRRIVQDLEGDEGQKHLDEYSSGNTARGKCLLSSICKKLGFSSLAYQSLDGLLSAIGIDKEKLCTYCWTGKE